MTAKSDKWWYRTLQVAYVLFGLGAVIFLLSAAQDSVPRLNEYLSTYSSTCDDGRVIGYPQGKNLNGNKDDYLLAQTQEIARFECSRPNYSSTKEMVEAYAKVPLGEDRASKYLNIKANPAIIPDTKNYSIEVSEPVYTGNWLDFTKALAIACIILFIFMILVRAIALYVLFKESFRYNLFPFWRKKDSTES